MRLRSLFESPYLAALVGAAVVAASLTLTGNLTVGAGGVLVTSRTDFSVAHGEIQIPSNLSGKAPLGVSTGHYVSNGTNGPMIAFGYNTEGDGSKWLDGEHTGGFYVEGDYNDGVRRNVEFYLQYQNAAASVSRRPFFFQFNRATDALESATVMGSSANGLTLTNEAGTQSANFNTAATTINSTLITLGDAATDATAANGDFTLNDALFTNDERAPTTITADQNNYTFTGIDAAHLAILSSDAARNITGLVADSAGRRLWLCNAGSFTITLKHQSASSTATNRFQGPGNADSLLAAGRCVGLFYSAGYGGRWLVLENN
jgi:hypothetical protein